MTCVIRAFRNDCSSSYKMLVLACLLINGFLISRMTPLVRKHITPTVCKMVQQDVAFNLWMQRFRGPKLTAIVKASAATVCVEFFSLSLPLMVWCGYVKIGWLMILYMGIQNYLGLYLKDLFCAPRPLKSGDSCDVKRLAAIVGACGEAHYNRFLSPTGAAVAVSLSIAWGMWIGLGRMYAAMHSLTDVLAGAVLCTITVPVLLLSAPALLSWMQQASLLSIAAASLGSILVYPKPLEETPSYSDAVAFIGAATGSVLGVQQRAGCVEQPPFDIQKWEHFHLTALQVLCGVLLSALSKEVAKAIAKPVMGVLLGAAPVSLRRLWQPPVHGHQLKVKQDTDADGNGVTNTDSTIEKTASREGCDASSHFVARNGRGEAIDVLVYSRVCSYAALGFCVTYGSPRMFQFLGIERT